MLLYFVVSNKVAFASDATIDCFTLANEENVAEHLNREQFVWFVLGNASVMIDTQFTLSVSPVLNSHSASLWKASVVTVCVYSDGVGHGIR